MIQIAALTAGKTTPSSRFRIRQHIKPLQELSCNVHEFLPLIEKDQMLPGLLNQIRVRYVFPAFAMLQLMKIIARFPGLIQSYKHDITWLERDLIPGLITLEPFIKRPFILDVDDAIWHTKPFGNYSVGKIAQKADLILAGNSYLADWLSKYSKNIHIVPTAVNVDRFDFSRKRTGFFMIGWTGTGINLPYLYMIEKPLNNFLHRYSNSLLCIISDQKPKFNTIPQKKIWFIEWNKHIETEALSYWDIGLMPLPDNEFTRGKCAFKMLQYMAASIPVVVSPVGMNNTILQMENIGFGPSILDEWYDCFEYLYKNPNSCQKMGDNGRRIVENIFDTQVVSKKLAKIFLEIA